MVHVGIALLRALPEIVTSSFYKFSLRILYSLQNAVTCTYTYIHRVFPARRLQDQHYCNIYIYIYIVFHFSRNLIVTSSTGA